jgi:hypothetical protein
VGVLVRMLVAKALLSGVEAGRARRRRTLVGKDDGFAVVLTHWKLQWQECLGGGNACLVMHQATGRVGRGCFGGRSAGIGWGWVVVWGVDRMTGVGGRAVGDY